jgi:hypothetical protein
LEAINGPVDLSGNPSRQGIFPTGYLVWLVVRRVTFCPSSVTIKPGCAKSSNPID